jgi:hypothetical protein
MIEHHFNHYPITLRELRENSLNVYLCPGLRVYDGKSTVLLAKAVSERSSGKDRKSTPEIIKHVSAQPNRKPRIQSLTLSQKRKKEAEEIT